jgi:G2/mitotic-specific cyclin 3/4
VTGYVVVVDTFLNPTNTSQSQAHVHYSGYTLSQLRQLLVTILECCDNPQKHHAAVYEKYTDKRYKRASIFVESELSKGFSLPFMSRDSLASQTWRRK